MPPILPLLSCLWIVFADSRVWVIVRAELGVGLGAAKHCGGSRALTRTGVLPQINKEEGVPASGMHKPPVQRAAGCSCHQGCAQYTKWWDAPCCRHKPSSVAPCLLCWGATQKSLQWLTVGQSLSMMGLHVACPGQREQWRDWWCGLGASLLFFGQIRLWSSGAWSWLSSGWQEILSWHVKREGRQKGSYVWSRNMATPCTSLCMSSVCLLPLHSHPFLQECGLSQTPLQWAAPMLWLLGLQISSKINWHGTQTTLHTHAGTLHHEAVSLLQNSGGTHCTEAGINAFQATANTKTRSISFSIKSAHLAWSL